MRDPYVVSLRYRLVPVGYVRSHNLPPVEWTTESFHLLMADGIATVEMLEHYPSLQAARERVEPYLRRWEAHAALQIGRLELGFDFDGAEWSSQPSGPALTVVGGPGIHVVVQRHPTPPPNDFFLSPDAEALWHRYEGYLNGWEPLAAMIYACLSLVEATAMRECMARGRSKRQKAANLYGIEKDVLDKLGELSSEQFGDNYTARKFDANCGPKPRISPKKDLTQDP